MGCIPHKQATAAAQYVIAALFEDVSAYVGLFQDQVLPRGSLGVPTSTDGVLPV